MWFNNCFNNYNYGFSFMNMFNPFRNMMNLFMPANNFYGYNMPMNNIWQMQNYAFMPNNNSIFQSNYQNSQNIWGNALNLSNSSQVSSIDSLENSLKTVNETNSALFHGVKYNAKKGEILAKNVVEGLPNERKKPLCARFVKNAMVKSGFGPYIDGNGEYCKYILRDNPNFKEVKVKGNELASLPKGSVIVYDAFEPYVNKNGEHKKIGQDGHVTVALGNGKACSDVMEDEIVKTDKAYVFIPV